MIPNKRKTEKEVWETIKPFLDLPPTTINNTQSNEGMRQYMNARRVIADSIDPIFLKRFQEGKASAREILFQNFSTETLAKLANTDIRALVPDKKKR
jgi:hypothetical protein